MIEHIQIQTAAGAFDALAAGQEGGREVLLLHGFPQAAVEWEDQLAALGKAGYRAVAPDQRGYSPGVRPETRADYRMDELVNDVLALADQLGWTRFDLVGHDWGAVVGWHVAADFADRVRTFTAISVPHPSALNAALREDDDQQLRSAYVQVYQAAGTAERKLLADDARAIRQMFDHVPPPSRIADYIDRMSEPGALTAALNWYRAVRYGRRCGPVSVPTMYLWGTEDVAIGSTAALAAEQYVTGPYRFHLLEDVSHWVPEQVPELVSALIMDHLDGHA